MCLESVLLVILFLAEFYRVIQGFILGTPLFIIYVNDMSAVIKYKLLLYADDSGILVSSKDISHIEKLLTYSLGIVS